MSYRISSKFGTVAPHQRSCKDLWETLWKRDCELGIFPFNPERNLGDFEHVFEKLSEQGIKAADDFDAYASAFFPRAEQIVHEAQEAESTSDISKASELYLRASTLYRIARFPIIRTSKQREAWARNKETFFKGTGLLDPPILNVHIPHKHGISGEGKHIQVSLRVPNAATAENPVPLIIRICGLDGYRTEVLSATDMYIERGWASLAVEIPGTADSPGLKGDPAAIDRLWSSLLDWVDEQPKLDPKRRCAWGSSTGGYHAIRIAVTHKERLTGSVSHGGGCHGMFDPIWLEGVNQLEYPFPLAPALCETFGFESMEDLKKNFQERFSLLENGMLDMECAPLMLANGIDDEVFPIEDYYLALEHGPAKAARFATKRKHMGMPDVYPPQFGWVEQLFAHAK